MATRSQEWATERCWCNYGSLKGMVARLRQIARSYSTIEKESEQLKVIAAELANFAIVWNSPEMKAHSRKLYMKRTN